MKTYPVIVQRWDESEAGWGIRPDGYSVHLSEEDRKEYCKQYWDREKAGNLSGTVPHEYSREGGNPYLLDVTVKTYKLLQTLKKEGKPGLRVWNSDELDKLRPKKLVQKEKEEREVARKAAQEKYEKERETRRKLNEQLYGKNYDPNRGWRSF